jgi:hypothetical protein
MAKQIVRHFLADGGNALAKLFIASQAFVTASGTRAFDRGQSPLDQNYTASG